MKTESWNERVIVRWVDPIFRIDLSQRHIQWELEDGWVTNLTREEFTELLKVHRDKRDGHMKHLYAP